MRHRHDRPVPPAPRPPASRRALLHARRVPPAPRGRGGDGLLPRRVGTARALLVPRPPGLRFRLHAGAGGGSGTVGRGPAGRGLPRLRTARSAVSTGIGFAVVFVLVGAGAAPLLGADRAVERTHYQAPVYPDDLLKEQRQGNVLLTGRIDAQGKLGDLRVLAATDQGFIKPAAEAVRAWQFRPAMRDGRPVEIFANIGVRFRLQGDHRGIIPAPILGDLSVFPADDAGHATAPDGFPVRRGRDRSLRAEAQLDLPPNVNAR